MIQVYSTNDNGEAMVIKSLLEAEGIECDVVQESIGNIYKLVTDGLGELKIFVPEDKAEEAKALIEAKEK